MSASSEKGLYALCGSLMVLSSGTVCLRFWFRKCRQIALRADDWIALFGVITYIGACSVSIELAQHKAYGYGSAASASLPVMTDAKLNGQLSIAYDFLNMNTLACAKLSALFYYRRTFNTSRHYNRIIVTTVLVVVIWYISFDVLSALQCRSNFSAFWDGTFEQYCNLNLAWANGLAISDFVLDLWVLTLPIYWVLRLSLSLVRRISLVGVFLSACVGLGASIARIVLFFLLDAPGRTTLFIGLLESGVTITAVSLPTIWLDGSIHGSSISRESSGSTVDQAEEVRVDAKSST